MGVNSLPKTVTRQRLGCDLNPGPSASESSTLTTGLPRRLLNPIRHLISNCQVNAYITAKPYLIRYILSF